MFIVKWKLYGYDKEENYSFKIEAIRKYIDLLINSIGDVSEVEIYNKQGKNITGKINEFLY